MLYTAHDYEQSIIPGRLSSCKILRPAKFIQDLDYGRNVSTIGEILGSLVAQAPQERHPRGAELLGCLSFKKTVLIASLLLVSFLLYPLVFQDNS
jgi:hypothetical protein